MPLKALDQAPVQLFFCKEGVKLFQLFLIEHDSPLAHALQFAVIEK